MNREDPAGYYALLGISETASAEEIKAAFRQKAKKVHPDRNSSPDAVYLFQQINNAYEVLSNPETRAQYDTWYAKSPHLELSSQEANLDPLEPITCSCCQKVTAQPRYVIFYQVTSFILITVRSPIQGIFCSDCAEIKALKGTMVTWLMGWWGIPWGLIYSVSTILQNLFGGSKPNEINVSLLTYQAYVFASQNKFELARAIAADAQDLAKTNNTNDGNNKKLIDLIEKLLCALDTRTPIKRLENVWSIPNRSFYIQGFISSIVVTLVGLSFGATFYYSTEIEQSRPTPTNPSSANVLFPPLILESPPNDVSPVLDLPSPSLILSPSPSPKPTYTRPTVADNGIPFPSRSGYIDGYPVSMTDGYSSVIVDNTRNNSDVFAKLFTLDAIFPGAVRVFFIRAGDKFKIEDVRSGNYDVRYLDLDSGAIVRTEPFNLEETKILEGIEFSEVYLTLYEVSGGNMEVYPIAESDFTSIASVPNENTQASPRNLSPSVSPNPQLPKPTHIPTPEPRILSENSVDPVSNLEASSDNEQIFPMNSCGDLNTGQNEWYPVYVNYSEANVAKVQSLYCKDAIRKYREDIGLHSIQVASFSDRKSAIDFANFMKQEMGSGEVGQPTQNLTQP